MANTSCTFDKDARKTSEETNYFRPTPGYNVVTTLDLRLQQLAEKALEAKSKTRRHCDYRSKQR